MEPSPASPVIPDSLILDLKSLLFNLLIFHKPRKYLSRDSKLSLTASGCNTNANAVFSDFIS